MRVALFGGSFDPVHHGHLVLARDAVEQLALDRVIFLPAAESPHKRGRRYAPGALRMEMLRAATAGEPAFACDDRELRRGGTSYTVDTVEEILAEHPGWELNYLVGADNLPELDTWFRIDDLRRLVRFVAFSRPGADAARAPADVAVLPRAVGISATEIRNRVAAGRSIRYLVPDSVIEIIRRENLYRHA